MLLLIMQTISSGLPGLVYKMSVLSLGGITESIRQMLS